MLRSSKLTSKVPEIHSESEKKEEKSWSVMPSVILLTNLI